MTFPARRNDNLSELFMGDPNLQIARGQVAGMTFINKFGENPAITGDTTEVVWDGGLAAYPHPATALITHVSQTADQAAMREAVIEVQGLDANWNLVLQNVTLNDTLTTTAVALSTPLIRIFRMKVLADVVGDSPIRAHNVGETTDYAVIQIGNNQTLMALYTVPANKTAFITSYYGDVVPATNKEPIGTQFTLWVADRANSYEFQIKHAKGVPQYSSGFQHFFSPYYKVTEKSDIMLKATCFAEEGHVHGGFDIILIDN